MYPAHLLAARQPQATGNEFTAFLRRHCGKYDLLHKLNSHSLRECERFSLPLLSAPVSL